MATSWMSRPQVRRVSQEVAEHVEAVIAERLTEIAGSSGSRTQERRRQEDSMSDPERVRRALRLTTRHELRLSEISNFLGIDSQAAAVTMHRLVKTGEVRRVEKGVYALNR